MTAPTGNTAPLDHVLPDDPSAWTALDHAVATANLRGAIIAGMRQEADDWRSADPPICPTCNCDHSYWPWEMRDQYRATMRENAALRARVARLRLYICDLEDDLHNFHPDHPIWAYGQLIEQRRQDCNLQHGDLDGAGEGGE